jgi:hypothetical protein
VAVLLVVPVVVLEPIKSKPRSMVIMAGTSLAAELFLFRSRLTAPRVFSTNVESIVRFLPFDPWIGEREKVVRSFTLIRPLLAFCPPRKFHYSSRMHFQLYEKQTRNQNSKLAYSVKLFADYLPKAQIRASLFESLNPATLKYNCFLYYTKLYYAPFFIILIGIIILNFTSFVSLLSQYQDLLLSKYRFIYSFNFYLPSINLSIF